MYLLLPFKALTSSNYFRKCKLSFIGLISDINQFSSCSRWRWSTTSGGQCTSTPVSSAGTCLMTGRRVWSTWRGQVNTLLSLVNTPNTRLWLVRSPHARVQLRLGSASILLPHLREWQPPLRPRGRILTRYIILVIWGGLGTQAFIWTWDSGLLILI